MASQHCVKSVQIRSFFWSVFSRIPTEYGPEKTQYFDNFHAVQVSQISYELWTPCILYIVALLYFFFVKGKNLKDLVPTKQSQLAWKYFFLFVTHCFFNIIQTLHLTFQAMQLIHCKTKTNAWTLRKTIKESYRLTLKKGFKIY